MTQRKMETKKRIIVISIFLLHFFMFSQLVSADQRMDREKTTERTSRIFKREIMSSGKISDEGLPEINHKDENKINNCVSNLEWVSRWYNNNYGTHNKKVAAAKSKAVEASRFSDFRTIGLRFASTREAGRNGYDYRNVSACCRGCYCSKGNFYKNLYWRYA